MTAPHQHVPDSYDPTTAIPGIVSCGICGDEYAELLELSNRERLAAQFIQAFTKAHGYPPTVREIGAAIGQSSTSSTHHTLRSLVRKGYIEKVEGSPRTIRVKEEVGE